MFFPERSYQIELAFCFLAFNRGRSVMEFHRTVKQRKLEIDRLIRGLTPWPSAYTHYKGKQLKIWKAVPVYGEPQSLETQTYGKPGEIIKADKESVTVAAGKGALKIYELQLEGKKRMTAHDFLLGVKMQPGEILG